MSIYARIIDEYEEKIVELEDELANSYQALEILDKEHTEVATRAASWFEVAKEFCRDLTAVSEMFHSAIARLYEAERELTVAEEKVSEWEKRADEFNRARGVMDEFYRQVTQETIDAWMTRTAKAERELNELKLNVGDLQAQEAANLSAALRNQLAAAEADRDEWKRRAEVAENTNYDLKFEFREILSLVSDTEYFSPAFTTAYVQDYVDEAERVRDENDRLKQQHGEARQALGD